MGPRARSRTRSTGWSASESFAGKPVALINTSPRAFHAQAALREILATMAARIIPEAFASVSLTGKDGHG